MELKIERAIHSALEAARWAIKAAQNLQKDDIQEGLTTLKAVVLEDVKEAIGHLESCYGANPDEPQSDDPQNPGRTQPQTVFGEITL